MNPNDAMAETISLSVVHPHKHHEPSKLAGKSITSAESTPCSFCIKHFVLSLVDFIFSG